MYKYLLHNFKFIYDGKITPYSCSFSNIDNTEIKPFTSGFTFLGEEQKITTPNSESVGNNNSLRSNSMDSKLEQFQAERNNEFNSIQRQ